MVGVSRPLVVAEEWELQGQAGPSMASGPKDPEYLRGMTVSVSSGLES